MKAAIGMAGGAVVVATMGMQGMSSSMLAFGGLVAAACWLVSGWLVD